MNVEYLNVTQLLEAAKRGGYQACQKVSTDQNQKNTQDPRNLEKKELTHLCTDFPDGWNVIATRTPQGTMRVVGKMLKGAYQK